MQIRGIDKLQSRFVSRNRNIRKRGKCFYLLVGLFWYLVDQKIITFMNSFSRKRILCASMSPLHNHNVIKTDALRSDDRENWGHWTGSVARWNFWIPVRIVNFCGHSTRHDICANPIYRRQQLNLFCNGSRVNVLPKRCFHESVFSPVILTSHFLDNFNFLICLLNSQRATYIKNREFVYEIADRSLIHNSWGMRAQSVWCLSPE